jgi:CubicO group peptidase (beta-lactamase class C family)
VHIDDQVRRDAHFGAGPDTKYEIGSLTKTMTSLLFTATVHAGALRADTAAGSLLDLGSSHAAAVTLEELASHRSGLPRIASSVKDRVNAIAAVLRHRNPYSADLPGLLAHARAAKITARKQFSYSNLDAALLGQALAAHTGTGYVTTSSSMHGLIRWNACNAVAGAVRRFRTSTRSALLPG